MLSVEVFSKVEPASCYIMSTTSKYFFQNWNYILKGLNLHVKYMSVFEGYVELDTCHIISCEVSRYNIKI